MKPLVLAALLVTLAMGAGPPVSAQPAAAPVAASAPIAVPGVDAAVAAAMARTGVPGASVAVFRDGRLVHLKAYGQARTAPSLAATPAHRFPIGSVSKQFTAAAVLLLVEDGKLDLDAPVARYVPGLMAGDRITLRQVLSHTAGYRDYWPQDYVFPQMTRPVTPMGILDGWAKTPLDFEPETDWQYSNTGFVLAALAVERASGMPFDAFLKTRIFDPLGMASAGSIDQGTRAADQPAGHTRYALGATRPAPEEGDGWLYGAGALAMTAEDLLRWDRAMIQGRLLKPESWRVMQTSVRLKNDRDVGYGLGVSVGSSGSLRRISHGGAVSGYLAENRVWPEAGAATVVLLNGDFGSAGELADAVDKALPLAAVPSAAETASARSMLEALVAGRLERGRLTDNAAAYFTPEVLSDHVTSLQGLGPLKSVTPVSRRLRGGFTQEVYTATFETDAVTLVVRRDGQRFEQFAVYRRS